MEVHSKAAAKGALAFAVISLGLSSVATSENSNYQLAEHEGLTVQRSGAAVFAQTCARCHGSDGRAQTAKGRAVGATDLTSADWIPDEARDTRIVNRGKEEMPAFKGKLKPAEIAAVIAYIRRFKR